MYICFGLQKNAAWLTDYTNSNTRLNEVTIRTMRHEATPSQPEERRSTEQRNPASKNLDRMTAMEILQLMNREDRKVAVAVGREIRAIARATDAIVCGMRNGGRLLYVGAGTSGRLAVLDASECPPTFGTTPKLVQAIIAGGRRAVTNGGEAAEDSAADGERDVKRKALSKNDVVVGIAASGTTPYVLGALKYARRRGVTTVAITANRNTPLARFATIAIEPEVGPEVLTGSTRLKAGTSQKMVLNMLSTAVMVRLGHVYENLMIDVALTNEKLADRGLRILAAASGKELSSVRDVLRRAGRNLRVALLMLKLGVGPREAKRRLLVAKGNLWRALGGVALLKRRVQEVLKGDVPSQTFRSSLTCEATGRTGALDMLEKLLSGTRG